VSHDRNVRQCLTSPSAPLRNGTIFLMAQPPLLQGGEMTIPQIGPYIRLGNTPLKPATTSAISPSRHSYAECPSRFPDLASPQGGAGCVINKILRSHRQTQPGAKRERDSAKP